VDCEFYLLWGPKDSEQKLENSHKCHA
jgi:hypothetical protein